MDTRILETILNQLNNESSDITGSAVVATDGIPLCAVFNRRRVDPDRVGGMAAAMLALSTRVTGELLDGKVKQAIIESDEGVLLLVQADENSVLIITAREDAKIGMLVVFARDAVKKIKQHSMVSKRPSF